MKTLTQDIIRYISFLEKEYGFEISLCDLHPSIYPYSSMLAPYNTHRCHSCILLKKYPALQKKCVQRQHNVREKCLLTDHFYGMCYAGMGEYIFRAMHGDIYLGFISVSGYCTALPKAERRMKQLCREYGVPYKNLKFLFDESVKYPRPAEERIELLLLPLQKMIELLYLTVLKEEKADHKIKPADNLLNLILLYLDDNFTNNLTLEQIAADLHYSKSYLCHYFFSQRHMTIMYYVNGRRIELAKTLLANEKISILEIAFQVGYNDANYFSNIFKKHVGISPSRYRKRLNAKK